MRAAVTVALDASMEAMVGEIAQTRGGGVANPASRKRLRPRRFLSPFLPSLQPVKADPAMRRSRPLRIRTSILGLEAGGRRNAGSFPRTPAPAPDSQ